MKRASCSVGKRGITFGFACEAAVPDDAIWTVIHTAGECVCDCCAACTAVLVQSPTIVSGFGCGCSPGRGYSTGKTSTPVTSKAFPYGSMPFRFPTGASTITTGWFGSRVLIVEYASSSGACGLWLLFGSSQPL